MPRQALDRSFVVLVARIRALLRRGVRERPSVLSTGHVIADPATRRVTVGGDEVEVTAREFALLEYLLRHPGQVVAKSELYEHVWEGSDTARDHNVVEVYVGYLRRKLGRDVIETVRGAGYRTAEAASA